MLFSRILFSVHATWQARFIPRRTISYSKSTGQFTYMILENITLMTLKSYVFQEHWANFKAQDTSPFCLCFLTQQNSFNSNHCLRYTYPDTKKVQFCYMQFLKCTLVINNSCRYCTFYLFNEANVSDIRPILKKWDTWLLRT